MFYVEYNNHFNLIGNLFGCEVIVPHNVKSTYKYETPFLNVKTASSAFSRPTNEQQQQKKIWPACHVKINSTVEVTLQGCWIFKIQHYRATVSSISSCVCLQLRFTVLFHFLFALCFVSTHSKKKYVSLWLLNATPYFSRQLLTVSVCCLLHSRCTVGLSSTWKHTFTPTRPLCWFSV